MFLLPFSSLSLSSYESLGARAKEHHTTVSVIGIEGAGYCGLDFLGRAASSTGGTGTERDRERGEGGERERERAKRGRKKRARRGRRREKEREEREECSG